jgi:hypothetical protein
MSLSSCPACGGRTFIAAVPAAALRQEVRERNRFIHARLKHEASRAELKDLTDFMHDGRAELFLCSACGLLLRDEGESRAAADYEEDPNDPDLMAQVYDRYVQAFRRKADAWRARLRPHASVIELGSHLGAFLQAAEEWNWRPVGLDIGHDTSSFARSRGLTVRRETIEDTKIRAGSADAVLIWNCFEQLPYPGSTLAAARRLLGRHGLLVLRVPNAKAYTDLRAGRSHFSRRTLAWNNLLGFPYLYGYTVETLSRLVRRHGFEPVRGFNSELLTLPFPEPSDRLTTEQMRASRAAAIYSTRTTAAGETLTGPWIEIAFRKQEEVLRREPALDLKFLQRAA